MPAQLHSCQSVHAFLDILIDRGGWRACGRARAAEREREREVLAQNRGAREGKWEGPSRADIGTMPLIRAMGCWGLDHSMETLQCPSNPAVMVLVALALVVAFGGKIPGRTLLVHVACGTNASFFFSFFFSFFSFLSPSPFFWGEGWGYKKPGSTALDEIGIVGTAFGRQKPAQR